MSNNTEKDMNQPLYENGEEVTTPQNIEQYSNNYNEGDMWDKIANVAKKAGCKVIYLVLLLYYVIEDNDVPTTNKAIIMGAIGYFILPLDLVPDFIPFVGYADDMAALVAAYKAVKESISPQVEEKAKMKLTDWFGPVDDKDLMV